MSRWPTIRGLTARQRQALDTIRRLTVPKVPTVRALAKAMGVTSSTAFYFIKELRKKGAIL